ncbi:dienelactone hydrolase family protein [Arthrobacter crystallopoietes]|uniref:dienelactone hydrolase family protein n=1 Tax=Crystallibacter crystallopoietes TaxID=37928 RepID=UPI003D1F616D
MSSEIRSEYVDINGLRAYQALPSPPNAGRPSAGMLLLPMITGIGEQIREFADTIARETGVVALSWDPWHGKSSDDSSHDELSKLLAQLDDDTAVAEQEKLLAHMRGNLGLERVGVIGWCLGGRYAFILGGRNADLANVIAYHPTVTIPPAANHKIDAIAYTARTAAPVLMAYPGKDSIVSRESFLALQEALQSREAAPSIVHLYPEAKHGFSDKRRHNEQANADAFRLSWPQALDFIRETTRVAAQIPA